MEWNENVLAWMATLTGHERQHMIYWATNRFDSESYYNVPIERQTELHDTYLKQFCPTQTELHDICLEEERAYDRIRAHRAKCGLDIPFSRLGYLPD